MSALIPTLRVVIALGFLQPALSVLIARIGLVPVVLPATGGMSILVLGAVIAHARVLDPVRKCLPALCMLPMALVVAPGSGRLPATMTSGAQEGRS